MSCARTRSSRSTSRGIGLTDKPADGYDSATLAGDLVALMEALGHQRFAVVGHDAGYIISYRWRRITRTGSTAQPSPRSPGPRWRVCATRPLTMPVLAIGGAASWGERVGNVAANDV